MKYNEEQFERANSGIRNTSPGLQTEEARNVLIFSDKIAAMRSTESQNSNTIEPMRETKWRN